MKNLCLIDADPISYIVGWHNREHTDVDKGKADVNDFMRSILNATGADLYYTFLSQKSFRHDVYKVRPYKGNRPSEPAPWLEFWKPIIISHLTTEWRGFSYPKLEADDLISVVTETWYWHYADNEDDVITICSLDKDMKQIPGKHFDYKKGIMSEVDNDQANTTFWLQMMTGDTVDNIVGLPGIGPAKAQKLMATFPKTDIERDMAVRGLFNDYYGDYYGEVIFNETKCAVELLCQSHPVWNIYKHVIYALDKPTIYDSGNGIGNTELLKELGWAL